MNLFEDLTLYVKPGPWTGLAMHGLDWATCDIETRNPVRGETSQGVGFFFLFFHVE